MRKASEGTLFVIILGGFLTVFLIFGFSESSVNQPKPLKIVSYQCGDDLGLAVEWAIAGKPGFQSIRPVSPNNHFKAERCDFETLLVLWDVDKDPAANNAITVENGLALLVKPGEQLSGLALR